MGHFVPYSSLMQVENEEKSKNTPVYGLIPITDFPYLTYADCY